MRFWGPLLILAMAIIASSSNLRFAMEGADGESSILDADGSGGSSNMPANVGLLLLAVTGCVLLTQASSLGKTNKAILTLFVAVVVYALASCVWSDAPGTSLRRTVLLGMTLAGAWGIAKHWRAIDLCRAVLCITFVIMCASIAAEIRYGTFLGGAEYRFAGLMHPNRQASNCGLLVLAALAMYTHSHRRGYLLLAALGAGMLVLTKSRGGALSCLVGAGAFWWLGASSFKRAVLVYAVVMVAACAMLWDAFTPAPLLDLQPVAAMGREDPGADPTTLTGRIPIWIAALQEFQEQPLLGYGYDGFWTTRRIEEFSYIHDWEFSSAHSIYIEVLLNLGVVGFVLGFVAIGTALLAGVRAARRDNDPGVRFILAVCALAAVNGLVEAIFVNGFYPFVIVVIGLLIFAFERPQAEGAQP